MCKLSESYDYEHIIIDNASTDESVKVAKELAILDKRIKIIVNARNFGPVRSPYFGTLSGKGDATILMASDLQDPPELIPLLIAKWEAGYRVVLQVKPKSEENFLMRTIRNAYYKLLNSISDIPLENNATGAGLFDKAVIEKLKEISDPYPYFRGLVCELGFSRCNIEFLQPKRRHGASKASFYGMMDQALLAMTKHSKLPLRLMTFIGLGGGVLTFLLSVFFFALKILFWDSFSMGVAPLLIGVFFIASIQLFFLGILGEYVGMTLTHVRNLPLVIEKERINFDFDHH
jgi:glycosyltransferase involved in cell wall biosynthesis